MFKGGNVLRMYYEPFLSLGGRVDPALQRFVKLSDVDFQLFLRAPLWDAHGDAVTRLLVLALHEYRALVLEEPLYADALHPRLEPLLPAYSELLPAGHTAERVRAVPRADFFVLDPASDLAIRLLERQQGRARRLPRAAVRAAAPGAQGRGGRAAQPAVHHREQHAALPR